ncbi:hypothetical protein L1887_29339 [Cichorium endivia]|nr:hypothetical protein L1887_29339 [Cichorium endivia]
MKEKQKQCKASYRKAMKMCRGLQPLTLGIPIYTIVRCSGDATRLRVLPSLTRRTQEAGLADRQLLRWDRRKGEGLGCSRASRRWKQEKLENFEKRDSQFQNN